MCASTSRDDRKQQVLEAPMKKIISRMREQLNSGREPEGSSYVFVGPPNSGKTVYFACAIDRLQRDAIDRNSSLEVTPQDHRTLTICSQVVRDMSEGRWPAKTQDVQTLQFNIKSPWLQVSSKHSLGVRCESLICHDYTGESFSQAFGDCRENSDEASTNPAKQLMDALSNAKGVFVVIDAATFDGGSDERLNVQLFNLFKHVEGDTKISRVAIIFSKMDIFKRRDEERILNHLKKEYPSVWNLKKQINSKHFFVSSTKSHQVDIGGCIVPPAEYETSQSDGLIEPLIWMLDLKSRWSL
jgi:hypothetical protein